MKRIKKMMCIMAERFREIGMESFNFIGERGPSFDYKVMATVSGISRSMECTDVVFQRGIWVGHGLVSYKSC